MYFQNGSLTTLLHSAEDLLCIRSSPDRQFIAVCSANSLEIWKHSTSTKLFGYKRNDSINDYGVNKFLCWKSDGSGIAVVTDKGFIILFQVRVDVSFPFSYKFTENRETLPDTPLTETITLEASVVVDAEGEVGSLTAINDDIMAFTTTGGTLRQFLWGGQMLEEMECEISQFYFTDPTEHAYLPDNDLHVTSLCYSQTLEIAAVTLSNGRAAYLSSSDYFKPGTVHALLAPALTSPACASSINPRYHLVVFGTTSGEVVVFVLNYDNGLLNLSHRLTLEREGKVEKSPVVQLFWTPEGSCLSAVLANGAMGMWSVYGSHLYTCPHPVTCGSWDPEGYHLWLTSGRRIIKLPFLKSPLTVNAVSNNQQHVLLQSATQVFILPNQFPPKAGGSVYGSIYKEENSVSTTPYQSFIASLGSPLENWPWQVIKVPDIYITGNSPIRYVAIGSSGQCTAVAGTTGFAFYISAKHRWRCFGNEAQEKSLVVRGGMLWWRGVLIVAGYHPDTKESRIYMYPHHNSIDQNCVVCTIPLACPAIAINTHDNQLAVVTSQSKLLIFALSLTVSPSLDVQASYRKILEFSVAKFTPHPCAVVSVHLTPIGNDAICGSGVRSVLLNVAGKLLIFDIRGGVTDVGKPVTIASGVEGVWCPPRPSKYLGSALWVNCGLRGVKVWMPLHDDAKDELVTSSRRILLTLNQSVYPLVIHHHEAALLGIPNDTLKCRSETFLHNLLHQLVIKNLERHAHAIAHMCSALPYFHHTLELLIHKALEADMARGVHYLEDDPVLPQIIRYMRRLPQYLSAVAHCARKTEMTQWEYLFQCTGLVTDLLDECLAGGSLDTAVLYLLVLQNLHPLPVSRLYTIRLLEASVKVHRWDLAVDLERFLLVISQEHETYSKKLSNTVDLAGRLRRSSESYDLDTAEDPLAPLSPSTPQPPCPLPALDNLSSDRVIIDHAHHLLLSCQFTALGQMSYHLTSFSFPDFLTDERSALPEIADPAHVFMSIHEDLTWPYPDQLPTLPTLPAPHPEAVDDRLEVETESVCSSLYSDCRVGISPERLSEALKRGSAESEGKLSWFLGHFTSARVAPYALLFALALRDVPAILDLVKGERELLPILMAVAAWAEQESPGYALFLQSLKPLVSALFPIQTELHFPLARASSRSSLNSTSSLDKLGLERAIEGLTIRPADRINESPARTIHVTKEQYENGCAVT